MTWFVDEPYLGNLVIPRGFGSKCMRLFAQGFPNLNMPVDNSSCSNFEIKLGALFMNTVSSTGKY
jgi:hypothetical protein